MTKSTDNAGEWKPVVEPSPATVGVMNDPKWNELRLAMDALGDDSPHWWALSTNGSHYGPDGDWFHHFRTGSYRDIVHVDVNAKTPTHREAIRAALKRIKVPGIETELGFRIFGHIEPGQYVDYI